MLVPLKHALIDYRVVKYWMYLFALWAVQSVKSNTNSRNNLKTTQYLRKLFSIEANKFFIRPVCRFVESANSKRIVSHSFSSFLHESDKDSLLGKILKLEHLSVFLQHHLLKFDSSPHSSLSVSHLYSSLQLPNGQFFRNYFGHFKIYRKHMNALKKIHEYIYCTCTYSFANLSSEVLYSNSLI